MFKKASHGLFQNKFSLFSKNSIWTVEKLRPRQV